MTQEAARVTRFPGSRMMTATPPAGYGMTFYWTGERVTGEVVFDTSKEGPPGLAHGGAVAAVLDEAMGTACFEVGRLGFTASMTVNYRSATPLDTALIVRALVERVEGRKAFARAELMNAEGVVLADATAVFVQSAQLSAVLGAFSPDGD